MSVKDARINSVLNKVYNYTDEGVMTRRQMLETRKQKGFFVTEDKERDYKAEEKESEWLRKNAFNHPFGNERHPQTIAYNERKAALKNGIYKTKYHIRKEGQSWFNEITKIEYDYFLSL